jgi:hypothetical protein
MSIANEIKAINASAKKIHGADIHIMVARAVHFGHDDNLVIISGKNHKAAALDFVKVTPGAVVTEEFHPEMDWGDGEVSEAYTTSVITF